MSLNLELRGIDSSQDRRVVSIETSPLFRAMSEKMKRKCIFVASLILHAPSRHVHSVMYGTRFEYTSTKFYIRSSLLAP